MPFARTEVLTGPRVSYGPFKAAEAMPWLLMAIAFCLLSPDDLGPWLAIWSATNFCVLMAFVTRMRGTLNRIGHDSQLDGLSFTGHLLLAARLCLRMLTVMFVGGLVFAHLGQVDLAHDLLWELDFTGLNHATIEGRAEGAFLVDCTFLLVLALDPATGKPRIASAFHAAVAEGPRLLAAMTILIAPFVTLGVIQHVLVMTAWRSDLLAELGERGRNIACFTMLFAFASLRLWVTLEILAWGLRPATPAIWRDARSSR